LKSVVRASLDTNRVYIWNIDFFREETITFVDELRSQGFDAYVANSITELTDKCGLLYTRTPSTKSLFDSTHIKSGIHIVAIGADSPGKQELDPEIFSRANTIATNDHN
jgi:ornithine cyclodeaminase